ncbi:MAG TPA: hypothetical protein VGL86_22580 [Polyangia bacterium]
MERKSRLAMKITMGLLGAGLWGASLVSTAAGEARAPLTIDGATRALVYGTADARLDARMAQLAASNAQAAGAIGRVAAAANVDGVTRQRALAALEAAGTVDAQAAMRAALSSPAARGDATYPMLVARLGAVETPTFETLMYLAEVRAEASASGELALAEAASPVCHRLHQARAPLSHKR